MGDFKDLMSALRKICSSKGKTLTTLCGGAKKVGLSPMAAKNITYPVVGVDIGKAYGDARKQLFIYVLDPYGPGVEKPKPEPDDDSWI